MESVTSKTKFKDLLSNNNYYPFPEIVSALDSKQIPFKKNILFSYNPSSLAANEWNRCVDFYLKKTPNGNLIDLQNIMDAINEDESNYKEKLEEIAENVIREMYDIPDYIILKSNLKNVDFDDMPNEEEEDSDSEKKLTDEQKSKIQPLIEKRIILNSIIHGAAIHQWTSCFYLAKDELDKLSKNLIEHYNSYAALINYFNWMHPMALLSENEDVFNLIMGSNKLRNNNLEEPDIENNNNGGAMTQGFNRINIKEKTIEAFGINFPVLLHELSKGCIEFLLSRSIPDHLNEDELKYFYKKSDKYSHEFWHYYMGPSIWRSIINEFDITTQELPKLLTYISEMEYEDLAKLLLTIIYGENKEKENKINQIKKLIK
jgi:hypothetical protein